MTILSRLEDWRARGVISHGQHDRLAGLSRGEPFSVFLELNVLLYLGVLSFVAGLGWTVTTWSHQLGDVLIVTALSAILGACFWYCFTRAPSLIFDYVLYSGCLTWLVELAYLENRFHVLSGAWDDYMLATAGLFFFLAYRFDNRFVLSLALSSLAGWFGLTISHWPSHQDAAYRKYAVFYGAVAGDAGWLLHRSGIRPHFLGAYLNIAANVLFWAFLSGVFQHEGYGVWLLALFVGCGASLAWGLTRRQFVFVAYAAIYGYLGISSILLRNVHDGTGVFAYFVVTGLIMLIGLTQIARRFGREA